MVNSRVASTTSAVVTAALVGAVVTATPAAAATLTVAADGTAQYRTVQAAINAAPANSSARTLITIKAGTYREVVRVPANKPAITLQGLGSTAAQTVLVFNNSATSHGTFNSASMFVDGRDFGATNLTISNDYVEKPGSEGNQAVALHLNADRAVFRNVRLLGDQDTFLVNENTRAYMADSYVEGTVDFIFGGGTMVFERTTVHEKRTTGGPITAASTPATRKYGLLFYRCTVTATTNNSPQLGRPWRPAGQVLFREFLIRLCQFGGAHADIIHGELVVFPQTVADLADHGHCNAGALVNHFVEGGFVQLEGCQRRFRRDRGSPRRVMDEGHFAKKVTR